jgi:hypothetical protein
VQFLQAREGYVACWTGALWPGTGCAEELFHRIPLRVHQLRRRRRRDSPLMMPIDEWVTDISSTAVRGLSPAAIGLK